MQFYLSRPHELGNPADFGVEFPLKSPWLREIDGLALAGLRQRGCQFARRIAVIERGPTKPLVFKLDDCLDWLVVAGLRQWGHQLARRIAATQLNLRAHHQQKFKCNPDRQVMAQSVSKRRLLYTYGIFV
jgi:hypothetical protein